MNVENDRFWRISSWWLMLLLAFPCVGATPLKSPRRVIDGRAVDLTPLFQWWTNRDGDRPLTAWVHVSGSIVGTNSWGWTLEAQVESSSQDKQEKEGSKAGGGKIRVILKNPPRQEQADFLGLQLQLDDLNFERQRFSGQAASENNQSNQNSGQNNPSRQNKHHSKAQTQEARQAKQVAAYDQGQVKELDKEIADTRAKLAAFPNPDTYAVDGLALDTGQKYAGVPVYNYGAVLGR